MINRKLGLLLGLLLISGLAACGGPATEEPTGETMEESGEAMEDSDDEMEESDEDEDEDD